MKRWILIPAQLRHGLIDLELLGLLALFLVVMLGSL